jgi:hypothetical protein
MTVLPPLSAQPWPARSVEAHVRGRSGAIALRRGPVPDARKLLSGIILGLPGARFLYESEGVAAFGPARAATASVAPDCDAPLVFIRLTRAAEVELRLPPELLSPLSKGRWITPAGGTAWRIAAPSSAREVGVIERILRVAWTMAHGPGARNGPTDKNLGWRGVYPDRDDCPPPVECVRHEGRIGVGNNGYPYT